jgi:hypothetical protein
MPSTAPILDLRPPQSDQASQELEFFISNEKAVALYKEVLFLQTADMQAGLVDEI